jgi:mannose-6-phosphate isomerase-like protein (cupin superfamily)
MAKVETQVQLRRWQGGQHPTLSTITRIMQQDGLRPYMWMNQSNYRHAVRSHGYNKVLFVIDGTLEVTLPDSNQSVRLRSGDRIDIPAGVRHGVIVGSGGVKCVEASVNQRPAKR